MNNLSKVIILSIVLTSLLLTTSCSHEPEEITPTPMLVPLIEHLEQLEQERYQNLQEVIALRLELERRINELENPIPHEVITKEVEKVIVVHKEIPVQLTDWNTLKSLKTFLAEDKTGCSTNTTSTSGAVSLYTALKLTNNAMAQCKRLYLVPYEGKIICGALVDNTDYYYIRPETDEVWK